LKILRFSYYDAFQIHPVYFFEKKNWPKRFEAKIRRVNNLAVSSGGFNSGGGTLVDSWNLFSGAIGK
jgi:hypothetical protein